MGLIFALWIHNGQLINSVQVGSSESVSVDAVVPIVIAAVAHIGNHYWTNNDNRQLAKGDDLPLTHNCSIIIIILYMQMY